MTEFRRYAIYYAPLPGDLANATAQWLGWDGQTGQARMHPDLPGLPLPIASLTAAPRKYGFHGTIKAPFRLAPGVTEFQLQDRLTRLAAQLSAVELPGLVLQKLKGFLALVPDGDDIDLLALGAEVVSHLDDLRAPLTDAETARRRPDRLTARQRALLSSWGYPYVMEEFRFHLTLTDDLPDAVADAVMPVLGAWLAPAIPRPFSIPDLCLFAEDMTGRFHLRSRHTLAG
jgi:putative phosphonate metabolism protein